MARIHRKPSGTRKAAERNAQVTEQLRGGPSVPISPEHRQVARQSLLDLEGLPELDPSYRQLLTRAAAVRPDVAEARKRSASLVAEIAALVDAEAALLAAGDGQGVVDARNRREALVIERWAAERAALRLESAALEAAAGEVFDIGAPYNARVTELREAVRELGHVLAAVEQTGGGINDLASRLLGRAGDLARREATLAAGGPNMIDAAAREGWSSGAVA